MSSGDELQACGQPRACGQINTQEKAESVTPEDEAPRAYTHAERGKESWRSTRPWSTDPIEPPMRGPERPKGATDDATAMQIKLFWSAIDNLAIDNCTPEEESPRTESPHDQQQRMEDQHLPSVHDPNWPPPGCHAYLSRNWGSEQTRWGKGKANGNANGPVA